MTARTLPAGRATILYDDTLLSHADGNRFAPSGRPAIGGRGSAWIVPGEDGEWVLRHYRRGGLPAKFSQDLYLWTGLELTRPWLEWHLLAELHALGLPVPRPVAARVVRVGLFYRGDLLTRRIPAARTLAELLKSGAAVPWRDVGTTLRRFHDAGVWHADLNAHNVLLDESGGVWLLDFDRSERRLDGPWKQENLARLQRSLRKLAIEDPDGWRGLLAGYGS